MNLFGKKPTPEEYVKKWKRELQHEQRNLERTIRSIQMEEQKTKIQVKQLAKKGDKQNLASAKILAKEILRSRKATERLYKSKTQLNSVAMQLTEQMAMMKLSGIMAKSTQVMAAMNNLVKLPQLNKIMMAMSREMEKAGLIEEMMDDVMDDDEEIEDAADEEVNKIVEEITMGVKTARVATGDLPTKDEEKEEDLTSRLDALKS